ncbi:MAG: chromosomal replication initiator protein DnaA [Gammaproteobacteria bacterium]|nr:chromosomal replication initiator protein DnaA [Gammaproteobacteria bacterium]
MDSIEVWKEIKERLRNELEESIFEDYFSGLDEIYKEENNNIYLIVENAFYKKRIQNQYIDRMNFMLKDYYPESVHRFYLVTKDDVIREEENKKAAINTQTFSKKNDSGLNPDYTFSTFVVGDSNRFAHRYAVLVSEQKTRIANPIYIFGNVGLGKTHLMQAIGNAILESDANANIMYIGSQDFLEEYVKCKTRPGGYDSFSEKFDDIDVLLVDDIQLIESKTQTQMEFFKIFERLSNKNKLIIIASDRKASDLTNIMPRLTSRFEKGLALNIGKPEKELRVQILNSKLKQELPHPEEVPQEVLEYIATICDNNVRQLEGCLLQVLFYCPTFNLKYTVESAKEALKNVIDFSNAVSADATNDDIKRLISVVCGYFKINENDFFSSSRKKELVYARYISWYLLKTKYNLTYIKIGSLFGGKDHSTVMHGCEAIEKSATIDNQTKKNLENIEKRLARDTNPIN